MNEKHAGVPLLLYEKTTTYRFSDLSLNGNFYVLNVRVLVQTLVRALVRTFMRALLTQEIMRSRWCAMQNRRITLNEINGGCKKILSVSLSFWSNLKFFEIMFLAVLLIYYCCLIKDKLPLRT